jgi:uncharacterized PurR-regulated membrane protein YhhQ (DUF165 family)
MHPDPAGQERILGIAMAANWSMENIERRRRVEGAIFFLLFCLTIPAANWMILNVGTVCSANGPCLVPVAPGIMAPSAVLMVGIALVLRDLVQRRLGLVAAVVAILIGAALSGLLAPISLVVASATAYLISEFADLAVYTPLQERRFVTAVMASSMVGLVVDSMIFLWLAFGSLDFLIGQVIGKGWMVLLSLPLILLLRRRDAQLNLGPA